MLKKHHFVIIITYTRGGETKGNQENNMKKMNNEELEYMERFGRRVKFQRELIGMTQEELALKLGYKDKSSIGKIEKGVSRVPARKVGFFAKALDCEIADLLAPLREPDIDESFIEEVIKKNTVTNDSAEKLQHIMLILAQMNDDQITKAESILSTIFENN